MPFCIQNANPCTISLKPSLAIIDYFTASSTIKATFTYQVPRYDLGYHELYYEALVCKFGERSRGLLNHDFRTFFLRRGALKYAIKWIYKKKWLFIPNLDVTPGPLVGLQSRPSEAYETANKLFIYITIVLSLSCLRVLVSSCCHNLIFE